MQSMAAGRVSTVVNRVSSVVRTRSFKESSGLCVISIMASLIFYLPFWLEIPTTAGIKFEERGIDAVYKAWDGPVYVTVAATLWDRDPDHPAYGWIDWTPEEYADRLPVYPLLIRAFSTLFGYWTSALLIAVIASAAGTVLFYRFLRRYSAVPNVAFWIAAASVFWPARGFFYRNLAMTEPLFILWLMAAILCYRASRYTACGLFGALAMLTRPTGTLIIAAFGLLAIVQIVTAPRRIERLRELSGLLLMPLSFGGILIWHSLYFNDAFAAFTAPTIVRPELSLFPSIDYYGPGAEGIPYMLVLAFAGSLELVRRREWDIALLSALFFIPTLFVPTDASRYLLPVLPFLFFVAGDRLFAHWPVRYALFLGAPIALAYAWMTVLRYGANADSLLRLLD